MHVKGGRRHPERCVQRAVRRRCGVADLRRGLGPKRGVMGEVRSGRTTAGGDFDLASRAAAVADLGRREAVINLFFL